MDLDAFRWLLTEPGQALLARATQLYVDHAGDPVRTATALRRRDRRPRAHAAAALTQVELRARAVAKLGDDARADVLHPRRPRAGHPARVAAHRAARVALAQPDARCSTSAAASAATWSRWPGPG